MFRSGRWKIEKNTVKVVFQLRFHAAKVQSVGDEGLIVSVVPGDTGKPSVKSDKAVVCEESILWDNPVYEAVKFSSDPISGKFHERTYRFVLATGSSKSSVIGEASIDLAKYVEAFKVTLVSLPLKSSKTGVLNVLIQRMKDSHDQRGNDRPEDAKLRYKESSLMSRMSSEDVDEAVKSIPDDTSLSKGVSTVSRHRASSGSDLTMSSSGSSSGVEIPWQADSKCSGVDPNNLVLEEGHKSDWEWLRNDSFTIPGESFVRLNLEEESDAVVEKLKSEIRALSRQAQISDMEVETLRKQITKESKRGEGLFQELILVKEERDSLKLECEKLRVLERSASSVEGGKTLAHEGDECRAFMEELIQELHHQKQLTSSLQVRLQAMQNSKSETVRGVDDDKEQKALEELVNEPGEVKDSYLLEQQIMRMHSELQMYKRDKDELEMQMEQLALDYEIMKQDNHEMVNNLQHIQLREELKIQCEYSSCKELEAQIGNLEIKLESQSEETETALERIRELEDHISKLEDGSNKQARCLEADLEHLLCCQEKRVRTAEEELRKARLQNAIMADRLQEEVKRLSMQMESTFEANERLAVKALTEANELRLQKACLEERIKVAIEEKQSIRDQYEIRLEQLVKQVNSLENEIKNLQIQIEGKELLLQHQKAVAEETKRLLSDEILMLRDEMKQVVQLESDTKIKEDMFIRTVMKMGDSTGSGTTSKSRKPAPHDSEGILNCKEKIKFLQDNCKLKETELQMPSKAFLEKEKHIPCKIEEPEGTSCAPRQHRNHHSGNETQKVTDHGSQAPNRRFIMLQEKPQGDTAEMVQPKKRNKLMETKLKEIAGDIFRNKSHACKS